MAGAPRDWVETTQLGTGGPPAVEAARAALRSALEAAPSVDLTRIDPPPVRQPWSLQLDKLQLLAALVDSLKPRHVLELGAGVSTRVLAWAGAEAGSRCRLSSIDNDPDSIRAAKEQLAAQRLQAPVRFQFAPLVIRSLAGEDLPVYLLEPTRFASRLPIDFALVDGPPASLGGREGTLLQLIPFTRPGTMLLLDDAERPEEQAILAAWEAVLGDAVEIALLGGPSGEMAVIVVHQPIPRAELWAHRVRVAALEIASVLPPEASFALVDDGAWGDEFWAGNAAAEPFPSREGRWWGRPDDDAAAISALEELTRSGTRFLVFAWPAFWWLDHYADFAARLRAQGRCLHDGPRTVVFELS